VLPQHNVLSHFEHEETNAWSLTLHAIFSPVFWLTISGIVISFLCYIVYPKIPVKIARQFSLVYRMLLNKYGFDLFIEKVLVPLTKAIGRLFYAVGDRLVIDGLMVNGTGRLVKFTSRAAKSIQTGYLNHYMFAMVFGLLVLLIWLLLG